MKIAMIVPGSGGGFYCQNCLRDHGLARALMAQGQDVLLVPLYLPLFTRPEESMPSAPLFYGAVSLYLKHRLTWLRRMPGRLRQWLDSAPVLAYAAKRAGSTRASALAELTLSMLQGEAGGQASELDRLVEWLAVHERPDVVYLSNALLLGLTHRLRESLAVPVVCALQDEDVWINPMAEPARSRVWAVMRERAREVAQFVAVSASYAAVVMPPLGLNEDRVAVVHIGVDTTRYPVADVTAPPPVIGYLSRLAEKEGFGTLIDAFLALKRDPEFATLRLRATGGMTADDAPFLNAQRRRLADAGVSGDVEFLEEAYDAGRMDFLASLSLLSVPMPQGEAFGTYVIEAMAAGVPVVQPRVGAYPEILARAPGGVLYDPSDPDALRATLAGLLRDAERRRELGAAGRAGVAEHFNLERMARQVGELCARAVESV